MTDKNFKVLEYDKIINSLKEFACSEMTRDVISELKPFSEARLIRDGLDETDEAVTLILHKGPLPLGNFYDVSDEISMAAKGGSLTMRQLLHVMYNMNAARNVKNFLKGDLPPLPIHNAICEVLEVFPRLIEDIDRSIDSETEMNDNASTELRQIRAGIARQNEAIKERMNRIVNAPNNKTILQDQVVTVRDGRYVVPVKAEHRAAVPGIVHDRSASGATLFIEPQAIVEGNNKLRELEAEEKAEIDRILLELSGRVAEHADSLKNNQNLLLQLDLITAKGKMARDMGAEKPVVSDDGILELKGARHPLIPAESAVPIDIRIGEDFRALIVTGPNTGGKTVSLKTAGLLSLMTMTGLFIPAYEGSKVPVFDAVFADIGDEQSIEQSLSTFSSHMTNIVDIVKRADAGSLVLLDELGAGTDPTEGAALAISVIEELMAQGALILATTHYTELKKYALEKEGVENCSMEFNVETLSPTYRLMIGVPGKSNAFEISQKLGLDGAIINKARGLLEGKDLEFEDVLSSIEADRRAAEKERDEAIMLNIEMKRQKEELEKQMARFEKQKERMLEEARAEARDIIADAKEVSEEVKEELKELSKLESLGERNKRFDQSRKRIKDAAGRYKETFVVESNDAPVNIDNVKIGDRVKVMTLGQNGEIIGMPDDKGEILVQVGMMKIRAAAEDLKIINDGTKKKPRPKGKTSFSSLSKSKAQTVKTSIDVRGQSLDEARENVGKYIDDAYVAKLPEITIIHGKGNGILSKGLREMFKRNKHIASFRPGEIGEGGDGVTVIKFKG